MSTTFLFTKGRPTLPGESAREVLKYFPRPRTAWQPSSFRRENLEMDDLANVWTLGRNRKGAYFYNSGFSTKGSMKVGDQDYNIISKQELGKYMPDITFGPRSFVTPVSLMAARHGHRVTHDLMHSYDPYVGQLEKWKEAEVDHDKIDALDSQFVGLHPGTISCRSRLLRWLRRGPFFNEDHYFRRGMFERDTLAPKVLQEDVGLHKKIIRLANAGHLKEACETYKKLTGVPPVEVYRALLKTCAPAGLLADAIAIYEDGKRLAYQSRDGEIFSHLMQTAINAEHRSRVMWVFNEARGTFNTNTIARTAIEPLWMYEICEKALAFLLDSDADAEARCVYGYMAENDLCNFDLYRRQGIEVFQLLSKGEKVGAGVVELDSVERHAAGTARCLPEVCHQYRHSAYYAGGESQDWDQVKDADVRTWLTRELNNIDVMFVMRHVRFLYGKDILHHDRDKYLERALRWMVQLSGKGTGDNEPMAYMQKSKPCKTNPNIRVAGLSPSVLQNRLLPTTEGFTFAFDTYTRLVEESYPTMDHTLQSKYLARQPIHKDVPIAADFLRPPRSTRAQEAIVHPSVLDKAATSLMHSTVQSTAHEQRTTLAETEGAAAPELDGESDLTQTLGVAPARPDHPSPKAADAVPQQTVEVADDSQPPEANAAADEVQPKADAPSVPETPTAVETPVAADPVPAEAPPADPTEAAQPQVDEPPTDETKKE